MGLDGKGEVLACDPGVTDEHAKKKIEISSLADRREEGVFRMG